MGCLFQKKKDITITNDIKISLDKSDRKTNKYCQIKALNFATYQ